MPDSQPLSGSLSRSMRVQRTCWKLWKRAINTSQEKVWLMEKINVGIVGCGNILTQYVRGCRAFDILNVEACADIDMSRAKEAGKQWDIPKVYSVDELLADPSIQIVINLTIPKAHTEVNR